MKKSPKEDENRLSGCATRIIAIIVCAIIGSVVIVLSAIRWGGKRLLAGIAITLVGEAICTVRLLVWKETDDAEGYENPATN